MNRNPNVAGKKLLLIGALNISADLIEVCHRNGVKLGVTDNVKDAPLKRIADEAFDVDAFDVDGLAKLYVDHDYDGVMTQYVDRLLPIVARVADKLGRYSPFTEEQIKMCTNKEYFKKTCMKYGVPVPRLYDIKSEDDINEKTDIEFPVLVKPVDQSSSRGLIVCHNLEELKVGYLKSKEISHSGNVIVEAYLPYDEINVTYIAQDGNIQLAAIHDRYFNETQKGVIKVPDLYIYPSRYVSLYYEKYNDVVIEMLKGIGIKNGSLFMQAVVHNDCVYFYEAGMRLNGCRTFDILEYREDYNTLEHLMYYCLTGSMGKYHRFNAYFKEWYATLNVIGKPDMICNNFPNDKALESYPWLIKIGGRHAVGEKVRSGSAGTLLQLIARINLVAENKTQLIERIKISQDLFQVYDENGEDVVMEGHDVTDIKNRLDYEL